MTKKKTPDDYIALLKRLKSSGLSDSPPPNRNAGTDDDELPSVEDRVKRVLGIVNNRERNETNMLFFVMYDVTSNKVRRLIAKYLTRKGCWRVQRSIFLADIAPGEYEKIKQDLTAVQAAYENKDSILIVPFGTDYLKSMSMIGKNIQIDVITKTKNTIFF
jgi:CRISPR-associated endonuclease Cas2